VVQILVRITHRTLNKWAHDRFVRRQCRHAPSGGLITDAGDATNAIMTRTVLHVSHRARWTADALTFLDDRADAAAAQVITAAQRFVARERRRQRRV
jgi:L-rhamnose isomerase